MRPFAPSIRPVLWLATALCGLDAGPLRAASDTETGAIVVYGGSSAGVVAAVQASRMGHAAILISTNRHIGGMTSSGLGQTDIGRRNTIGGVAREFYERVYRHYEQDKAWIYESREEYLNTKPGSHEWYFPVIRGWTRAWGDGMAFTFEPAVARGIFETMLEEAGVTVIREERLKRGDGSGVVRDGSAIRVIVMESGRRFAAEMFIDATYEGDLMAEAGVPFIIGREGNARYGETLNGVQPAWGKHHQLAPGIDPYVEPGNPASGLLPGIEPAGPGEEGTADHRVQAYCFRLCLTDVKANQIPFTRPEGYDELEYELLFRNFAAGETNVPFHPARMPNRKTDTNNSRGVSSNWIGRNYAWADGDYATRAKLYEEHKRYQQGLMWTLATHLRVPEDIREEVSRWGYARDEFEDSGHWPPQLYVRVARRMVSDYVVTEHDIRGRRTVPDPVALGGYQMDSHNVQRYVDAGNQVRNEGDVQVRVKAPYGISYRAVIPPRESVSNLLVPVAVSASHIAYGSIRMEPVFMKLGQAAATAAGLAIDGKQGVHGLEYALLRARLVNDGQVLPDGAAEEFVKPVEDDNE